MLSRLSTVSIASSRILAGVVTRPRYYSHNAPEAVPKQHKASQHGDGITSARKASHAAHTARVPLGGLSGTPKSASAASTALCTLQGVTCQ